MSDLLETLQCYGYTPEAQNKIACAFTAAVDLREQDGEWDNEIHDVHGNMGMTMFLGLCHIFEHFHDDLAVVILKARDAHRRFRDLELSEYSNAAVETGITNHALGSKELRRAEEEAASKAAAQAVLALGGPFGGNDQRALQIGLGGSDDVFGGQ
ncbi:hypothetical protein B0A55_04747 [Friedmanniomyces simplex]|uniref:Uncharacterized protein n=1 Tax=Friedmanniomyces simplex TaxID=329884 RepID=A0A4V5NHB2_9PEZI|nr:hypothetical protein B0A55_04747 [Friedmanniomyces simplex]